MVAGVAAALAVLIGTTGQPAGEVRAGALGAVTQDDLAWG